MKNSLYLRSGLLALVLLAAIPAALGATSITGPTVISSPGTYVLAKDIAGGKSPAIWVKSSGVTIDGNGHTIRGAGGSYGILVNKDGTTLTGVTIKNVRLENWNCGIYFKGVASSTASGVTAVSNGKAGINLRTTRGTTISGCTVTGNQQGILLWQDCDGNTHLRQHHEGQLRHGPLARRHRPDQQRDRLRLDREHGLEQRRDG